MSGRLPCGLRYVIDAILEAIHDSIVVRSQTGVGLGPYLFKPYKHEK